MNVETVDDRQCVELFPTYGLRTPTGGWGVRVRGWIFENDAGWRWRRRFVRLLQHGLRLSPSEERSTILATRLRPFLVSGVAGRRLIASVGHEDATLPASGETGHVEGLVEIAAGEVAATSPWLEIEVRSNENDDVRASGRAQLLEPTGLSVVSDVDDTIKHSNITVRRELLANTFLRHFLAVPGMSDVYRDWETRGAAFHYVSNSPWQLTGSLARFVEDAGFPPGSMHLRPFRLRRGGLRRFLSNGAERKRATLRALLDDFPERRFVLVGDTSEQDPEIYGELARARSEQVAHALIRNVTGEPDDGPRLQRAFHGIDRPKWSVFRRPDSVDLDLIV